MVRGVPKGLICRPTTGREVERFQRSCSGSCGALLCLDTNPPDTVPEHKTPHATKTPHRARGKEGRGRQQGRSKTKVSPLSLVLGITAIHTLFGIPETWVQDYCSGMCRTFLKLTSSYRHQYLISLHRLKTEFLTKQSNHRNTEWFKFRSSFLLINKNRDKKPATIFG